MRAFLVALVVGGCAIGAPPGFSPGDTWTFPLVDPLSDGRLIVPVTIHGKGPYLFAIDRDALVATARQSLDDAHQIFTIVDPRVAHDAGVQVLGQMRVDDYHDTTHPAFVIELTDFQVGNLTRSLVRVAVEPTPNMFTDDGRHIDGILGRDFIADSLVFGFDRDRGIAWLQTQQAFKPPAGASVLELTKFANNDAKVVWQPVFADAKLGGTTLDLHPDFASATSQLAPERAAKLPVEPWKADVFDSAGTTRHIDHVADGDVTVHGVTEHVAFAPYEDRRFPLYHLDGTLGLDFFKPFAVAADWHHEKIYLTPRADARTTRLARWGTPLPDVKLDLATSADGPVLMVRPGVPVAKDVEIVVAATSKSGAVLPKLIVNLPAGTEGFDAHLDTRYEEAKLEIVDGSPFPRTCATTQGCLLTQSTPP